jgi:putative addiction module component
MTVKSILEAAMKLPKKEKLRLARRLEESVAEEDVLIAGAKEAEKALQAYERGEMGAKPADEVIRRLLNRKSKRK